MHKINSMAAILCAGLLSATAANAGALAVHDAVAVGDGSTRLVSCENTRGAFLLVRPIAPTEVYAVQANVRDSSLRDLLENILPAGWTVRYGSPGVEDEQVNLVGGTYWADALKVLSHDFNLLVAIDGERQEVMVGRL